MTQNDIEQFQRLNQREAPLTLGNRLLYGLAGGALGLFIGIAVVLLYAFIIGRVSLFAGLIGVLACILVFALLLAVYPKKMRKLLYPLSFLNIDIS